MAETTKNDKIVLVAVLKNARDLKILLQEKWYHIPVKTCPKMKFKCVAFYQPALFGGSGKCIKYYSRVLNYSILTRKDLFPKELKHPNANDYYFKVNLGEINELAEPIKNIIPRRVCFGFTTLRRLLESKNILQLYGVAPTEQIIENALKRAGIKTKAQHYVIKNTQKRYRLDFAIFCNNGRIAIECDNKKAHSSKIQKVKDKTKNNFLRGKGWYVIHFSERKIIFGLDGCIKKVQSVVKILGGYQSQGKNFINTK